MVYDLSSPPELSFTRAGVCCVSRFAVFLRPRAASHMTEPEREGGCCEGQFCIPAAGPSPSVWSKGEGKHRILSPQGTSPTPSRVAGLWYPVNGEQKLTSTSHRYPQPSKLANLQKPRHLTWGKEVEAQQRSPQLLLRLQTPGVGFLPGMQGSKATSSQTRLCGCPL